MNSPLPKESREFLKFSGELSTWIAVASFVIGSLLLADYAFFSTSDQVVNCGFSFVIVAFLLNAALLIYLFILFCITRGYREYFAVKMLIVLANLPIAFLYIYITAKIH